MISSLKVSEVTQSCPNLCDPMGFVAPQASLLMGSSRQEYWSGLPFPSQGGLPDPGFKLEPPTLQVDSLPFELPGNTYIKASTLPFMKYLPYEISRIK